MGFNTFKTKLSHGIESVQKKVSPKAAPDAPSAEYAELSAMVSHLKKLYTKIIGTVKDALGADSDTNIPTQVIDKVGSVFTTKAKIRAHTFYHSMSSAFVSGSKYTYSVEGLSGDLREGGEVLKRVGNAKVGLKHGLTKNVVRPMEERLEYLFKKAENDVKVVENMQKTRELVLKKAKNDLEKKDEIDSINAALDLAVENAVKDMKTITEDSQISKYIREILDLELSYHEEAASILKKYASTHKKRSDTIVESSHE